MPPSEQSRPQPNVVQLWLELIGTPERARTLLEAYLIEPVWRGCPSAALFGTAGSEKLYASRRYRPALDAWDTGQVTRRDVIAWAAHVKAGSYAGPAYQPPTAAVAPSPSQSLPKAA